MKKILAGLLLVTGMSYAVTVPITRQLSAALAAFQNSPDYDPDFAALSKALIAIRNTTTNTLQPQVIELLDENIDNYEDLEKDFKKSNTKKAFLTAKVEPLLEALKTLRSDIVYKKTQLEKTIMALSNKEAKNAERIKNIAIADKDHLEANGVRAYQTAKKTAQACCQQKADGEPCKISDECRGSCNTGFFGTNKCQHSQKYCLERDQEGNPFFENGKSAPTPAKCPAQPSYYLEYMKRHGLNPE